MVIDIVWLHSLACSTCMVSIPGCRIFGFFPCSVQPISVLLQVLACSGACGLQAMTGSMSVLKALFLVTL